jgi:hypothetical protein
MDTNNDDVEIKTEGTDTFVVVNGVKIARRAGKGKLQQTWISLEPGWRVLDGPNHVAIEYTPPRVQ